MNDKQQDGRSKIEKSAYERWEIPSLQEVAEVDEEKSIVEQLPSLDEIEKIRQDAYEEGFKQGKSDGFAAGLAIGQANADKRMLELLNAFGAPMQAQDKRVEDVLLVMISKMCKQIIQRELMLDSSVICGVVKTLFDDIEEIEKKCCIKLNPVDVERVKIFLRDHYPHVQRCRLEADKNISAGGCIFSSDAHYVDALLETRIKLMVNEVYDQYDAPCPAPLGDEPVESIERNEICVEPDQVALEETKPLDSSMSEVDTLEHAPLNHQEKNIKDRVQLEKESTEAINTKAISTNKLNTDKLNDEKAESAVIAAEHGQTAQKVSISDMPFFEADEESSGDR